MVLYRNSLRNPTQPLPLKAACECGRCRWRHDAARGQNAKCEDCLYFWPCFKSKTHAWRRQAQACSAFRGQPRSGSLFVFPCISRVTEFCLSLSWIFLTIFSTASVTTSSAVHYFGSGCPFCGVDPRLKSTLNYVPVVGLPVVEFFSANGSAFAGCKAFRARHYASVQWQELSWSLRFPPKMIVILFFTDKNRRGMPFAPDKAEAGFQQIDFLILENCGCAVNFENQRRKGLVPETSGID